MLTAGWRIRSFVVLLAVGSAAAAPALAGASPEEIREHFRAIRDARDTLVGRLADRQRADRQVEQGRDFSLVLHDAIVRRSESKGQVRLSKADLVCSFSRRGGKWFPGTGKAENYNLSRHDVDPSGLRLEGNHLRGELLVVLQPDPWVPPDHEPKHMRYRIDAALASGGVDGTLEGGGDYENTRGTVKGTVETVSETASVPAAGEEQDLPEDPGEASRRMAALATRAYQQSRAAVMCMRHYPLPYGKALELTSLPVPRWNPGEEKILGQVANYLSRLRKLLGRQVQVGLGAGEFTVDTLEPEDPFFGPYFDDEPLPVSGDGVAELPDDLGELDGQRWQRIPRWRTIATFRPDPRRDLDTPLLPELVPATGAGYRPNTDALDQRYDKPEGGTFGWVERQMPHRYIPPPGQPFDPVYHHRGGRARGATGVHGADSARWYGAATVRSEKEVELWAAAYGQDYGKLWVNGELAWVSRQEGKDGCSNPSLLKVHLKKGLNRILLSCQSRKGPSYFWVMLSTGAGPLSPEQREAVRQKQKESTVDPPPDPRRGRRGDWSGRFPQAEPPLGWDVERGVNVRWRTPLPDYSNANPIIVGDKVLVNCEPHTLYCLDKATGEVLWRRESHIVEFLPADEQAEARKAWDAGYAARKSPQRRQLHRELASLANELRELEEAGKLTEAKEAEVEAKQAPLREKLEALDKRNRAFSRIQRRLGVKAPEWNNNIGWTFPAPCSDGEHVWVKYNTGVVACYDLEGNRQWMKRTHMSGGVAQVPSPILIDGKVVIQGRLTDRKAREEFAGTKGSPPYFTHKLMAFDQATGEIAWERPIWASGGYGSPGGVVPMRLANGETTRELIITSTGLVVDPADGKLLSNPMGVGRQNYYADPIVAENRAYLYRSKPVYAVEIWLEPGGKVGSRVVAQAPAGGGNAGAAWWNGYVFGSNGHPSAGRTPVPWHDVAVADMRTGEVTGKITAALREGGLAYTPAASTRDYGVVVGTGPGPHSWSISNEPAEIGFIVPGPEPYVASTCKLDGPMVAQPVFEGEFMYVRTHQAVMCIGATTPEGKRHALKNKARTILSRMPRPPKRSGVIDLALPADFDPPAGVPVEECGIETAPGEWLVLGPFDRQEGEDPLALLELDPSRLRPGQEVSIAGTSARVRSLEDEFVEVSKGWREDMFARRFYSAANKIDLLGPIDRKAQSLTYYYAVVRAKRSRVVRVQVTGGKFVNAWIAGQQVETDDRVRLQPGLYPVLLSVELGAVPPFGNVVGGFRLRDCDDPRDAYPQWLGELEKARPRLERIVDELPGTAEAHKAVLLLKHDPNYTPPEPRTPAAESRPGSAAPAHEGARPVGQTGSSSRPMGLTWPIVFASGAVVAIGLLVAWKLRRSGMETD